MKISCLLIYGFTFIFFLFPWSEAFGANFTITTLSLSKGQGNVLINHDGTMINRDATMFVINQHNGKTAIVYKNGIPVSVIRPEKKGYVLAAQFIDNDGYVYGSICRVVRKPVDCGGNQYFATVWKDGKVVTPQIKANFKGVHGFLAVASSNMFVAQTDQNIPLLFNRVSNRKMTRVDLDNAVRRSVSGANEFWPQFVNQQGMIAGRILYRDGSESRALFRDQSFMPLASIQETYDRSVEVTDMNARGQVILSGTDRYWLWENGVKTVLADENSWFRFASINDNGELFGSNYPHGNFIWNRIDPPLYLRDMASNAGMLDNFLNVEHGIESFGNSHQLISYVDEDSGGDGITYLIQVP